MKTKLICVLGISCVALIVAGLGWGQAYMDQGYGNAGHVDKWKPIEVGDKMIGVSCRPGIGARVAYFFPYSNDDVNSEIAYEGIISYAVSNIFACALTGGYTDPEFLAPVSGRLETTYLNLTFELRGEPEPNFGLYLGFGPSLYFTNFKSQEDDSLRSDDTFGLHISMGIDYFVLQDLAINIDVKHLWFVEDIKYRLNGVVQPKEKLNAMVFGVGLKYFF